MLTRFTRPRASSDISDKAQVPADITYIYVYSNSLDISFLVVTNAHDGYTRVLYVCHRCLLVLEGVALANRKLKEILLQFQQYFKNSLCHRRTVSIKS